MADDNTNPSNSSADASSPLSRHFLSTPPPPPRTNIAPFRPSIAVIVGVLTTMFSVTFLLLLYAKHCKRTGSASSNHNPNSTYNPSGRRNSGIDRSVIESLPVFRFGSLQGQKDGLECAVCLNRFDPTEVLRLLPKCKHAFHVECVDTWLDAHSTCPLCRYRVDPEDVLLVDDPEPISKPVAEDEEKEPKSENRSRFGSPVEFVFHRISGRHSSAGEKSTGFLRLSDPEAGEISSRRSVDGGGSLRKPPPDAVCVGCLDRPGCKGPDPVLAAADRKRFEHRIIVSDAEQPFPRRWSDFRPSDLLFLRSEMILTGSGRYSLTCARLSCPSSLKQPPQQQQLQRQDVRLRVAEEEEDDETSGRIVISSRCVSEITGLSRFRHEEEEKAVNRWLGFAAR